MVYLLRDGIYYSQYISFDFVAYIKLSIISDIIMPGSHQTRSAIIHYFRLFFDVHSHLSSLH